MSGFGNVSPAAYLGLIFLLNKFVKLFSNLFARNLAPEWKFTTKGVLWRLLPSEDDYFVGEDRDLAGKSVTFFCINPTSGKVYWHDVQFHEKWWIGIETIHRDIVFFHEFASPDLPGHKKIYAVELLTGKLLWFNEELEFLFAYDEKVYASRVAGEQGLCSELDLRSGAALREPDFLAVNAVRDTVLNAAANVQFPQPFDASVNVPLPVGKSIEQAITLAGNPDSIEYLEANGKIIVGYHDNVSPKAGEQVLIQNIVIVDPDAGKIIYRDQLNSTDSAVSIPVPDMFFGRGSFVYYVKEKKTLTAIDLKLQRV